MIKLVLTTLETSEQADAFAKALLAQQLAACVSVSKIEASHYHWDGALQKSVEIGLTIKTTSEKLTELESFFKQNHPYDLPEFIILDASASQPYEAWMRTHIK